MVIQHNIPAINSHRNLGVNNNATAKNLEKLSSGYRINRAGDDAAGLAISEKMRGQIRGLAMAEQNTSNAISMIQTAEGGLNETHAILQRMRELAVQASNGTYDDAVDRANIDKEIEALKSELNRIASSTNYNGMNLLDGTLGGVKGNDAGIQWTTMGFSGATTLSTDLSATALAGKDAYLVINKENQTITLQIGGVDYKLDGLNFKAEGGAVVATLGAGYNASTITSDGVVKLTMGAAGGAAVGLNTAACTVGTGNSEVIFQIGANGTSDQQVGLHIANMSAANIGGGDHTAALLTGKMVSHVSLTTRDAANESIKVLTAATNQVSMQRAELGAMQNRLEHTMNNLGVTKENLTAAESTIRDVDMAKEMMEFTKNSILVQASQAMLAQANQLPQGILQLLR